MLREMVRDTTLRKLTRGELDQLDQVKGTEVAQD